MIVINTPLVGSSLSKRALGLRNEGPRFNPNQFQLGLGKSIGFPIGTAPSFSWTNGQFQNLICRQLQNLTTLSPLQSIYILKKKKILQKLWLKIAPIHLKIYSYNNHWFMPSIKAWLNKIYFPAPTNKAVFYEIFIENNIYRNSINS